MITKIKQFLCGKIRGHEVRSYDFELQKDRKTARAEVSCCKCGKKIIIEIPAKWVISFLTRGEE